MRENVLAGANICFLFNDFVIDIAKHTEGCLFVAAANASRGHHPAAGQLCQLCGLTLLEPSGRLLLLNEQRGDPVIKSAASCKHKLAHVLPHRMR